MWALCAQNLFQGIFGHISRAAGIRVVSTKLYSVPSSASKMPVVLGNTNTFPAIIYLLPKENISYYRAGIHNK
jgi:hypothetical protein